jgi:hypothetical protein
MRITEDVIAALISGAVLGSVITYFYVTREKRFIARVRKDISEISIYSNLSSTQFTQTVTPERTVEIVSDDRILKAYRWAREAKSVLKLNPERLAANIIIFEELLGLTARDAIQAMKSVEYLPDLPAYIQKIQTEKRTAATRPKAPSRDGLFHLDPVQGAGISVHSAIHAAPAFRDPAWTPYGILCFMPDANVAGP